MKKNVVKIFSLLFCCLLCVAVFTGCSFLEDFGKSAYDIARDNGFVGTEQEWLDSLKGKDGEYAGQGDSAYDIAVKNGFVGSEEEWLNSLVSSLKSDDANLQYATNLAMRSCVKINAYNSTATSYNTGSGVIVDYDSSSGIAYIMTCYHVIVDTNNYPTYARENIKIFFYGSEDFNLNFNATFIGGAIYSDIAFLKVLISSSVWQNYSLRVCDIDLSNGALGETVIAIGNSNGGGLNAVRGSISKVLELSSVSNINGTAGSSVIRVSRFDALVAHGNSGGGIFNSKGELVGMVNAKSANEDGEEANFAYAIPISMINAIYQNIRLQLANDITKSYAMPDKYTCGISLEARNPGIKLDDSNNSEGVYDIIACHEAYVTSSSVSAIQVGDQILNAKLVRGDNVIFDIKVYTIYDISELIWYATHGDKLTLKYVDESDSKAIKEVTITLTNNTYNPDGSLSSLSKF